MFPLVGLGGLGVAGLVIIERLVVVDRLRLIGPVACGHGLRILDDIGLGGLFHLIRVVGLAMLPSAKDHECSTICLLN
ncbi:hypothetical protein [Propionibacterium freudenreichii]|uniref:hypothetical protein n=1 Tax=Propionibacterium freudenreichii TaxID=1744 RepID=UPI00254A74D3|nr:hypothetical protein [Propionibacterium freudenreichii]